MAQMHGRLRALAPAIMGLVLLNFFPASGITATKEEAKQIIVPQETSSEAPKSEIDNTSEPKIIPDDALPTLDRASDQEDNSQPDIDNETVEQPNAPPPPEIKRDISKLPEPVRRIRELILKAAKKGDIEELRSLIGVGETATTLSIGGLEGDPISYLKEASGDDDGHEILAILIEVLEAGYVLMDQGTEDEVYVWPYFFAWPLDKLDPKMKVELFTILTAGDLQDSADFGSYIFYRVGIRPDGKWEFFVAGD